jgi:superfamily I DNA/RNA helicase
VGDLLEAIDALFQSKGRGITLSSVHKSKGREWERVFILDFGTYMPSKYAKKDWQKIQENNLIYVAITRAKRYLGYLPSNCWKDAPNMVIPERPARAAKPANARARKPAGLNGSFNPFGN